MNIPRSPVLGCIPWLQPDASVQTDGLGRTHFRTRPATAAGFRVYLEGGLAQGDRLSGTERLASPTERTRCFVDTRNQRWMTGTSSILAGPNWIDTLYGRRVLLPRAEHLRSG